MEEKVPDRKGNLAPNAVDGLSYRRSDACMAKESTS